MAAISTLVGFHARVFAALERLLDGWFLGLVARLVFAGVLLFYYWNSVATKLGSGFPGVLVPQDGAYFQILPPIVELYGFDTGAIPFLPWGLIVLAGTYAELLLPLLITVGLFTRLAALGMIGFIAVQTFVDIVFHGVEAETIGALFDGMPDSVISDQRSLWVFLLLTLVVKGAGAISLDGLLSRRFGASARAVA